MRTCLFCNGRPLAREHIIPRRISRISPSPGAHSWQAISLGPFHRQADIEPSFHRHSFNPVEELTVKAVCGSCNNGWMSALESEAMAPLTALVSGSPRWLSRHENKLLTRWASKTALMLEQIVPGDRPSSANRLASVATGRELPGCWVSVGRLNRPTSPRNQMVALWGYPPPGAIGPQRPVLLGQTTLVLSHAVIVAVYTADGTDPEFVGVQDNDYFCHISSRASQMWPPISAIEEQHLRSISHGLITQLVGP